MPQRDRSVNSRRRPAIISSQPHGPAKPAVSSAQDNLRTIAMKPSKLPSAVALAWAAAARESSSSFLPGVYWPGQAAGTRGTPSGGRDPADPGR